MKGKRMKKIDWSNVWENIIIFFIVAGFFAFIANQLLEFKNKMMGE